MNKNKLSAPSLALPESASYASEDWRERFLRSVMIGALIFGFIALIPNILQAPNRTFATIYITVYLILCIITFTSLPYKFRAGTLLFLFYALGVIGLVQDGLWGDARLFFLALIGMSLLLFTSREGMIATILSILTLFLGEFLLTNGFITISNPEVNAIGTPGIWITSGTILLLLAVAFITGLNVFQKDFTKAQQNTQITLETLKNERRDLEDRVQERTYSLARKTEQMRAASYVARQMASKQDFGLLLFSAVNSITEQFGYYHAGIFLLNEKGDYATLQAASSGGGKELLAKGYGVSLASRTDPVAIAASRNKPQIVLDFGDDAVIFNNPQLPATRSQIVAPIILGNNTIGVLDVQSTESRAFTKDDIDVFQSLVDHFAIAIENARLLNETKTVLMQLEAVNIARTSEAWDQRLKSKSQAYTFTSMGIRPEKQTETLPNSLNIPITLRGHEIGEIALSRKEGETWDENDQTLAAKVASQVGLAIDNLRLLEDAQKSASRDQILTNVSSRIRETLDMESILQRAAREFQKALNLKEAEIRLGAPDTFKKQDAAAGKITTGRLQSRSQGNIKKKN